MVSVFSKDMKTLINIMKLDTTYKPLLFVTRLKKMYDLKHTYFRMSTLSPDFAFSAIISCRVSALLLMRGTI